MDGLAHAWKVSFLALPRTHTTGQALRSRVTASRCGQDAAGDDVEVTVFDGWVPSDLRRFLPLAVLRTCLADMVLLPTRFFFASAISYLSSKDAEDNCGADARLCQTPCREHIPQSTSIMVPVTQPQSAKPAQATADVEQRTRLLHIRVHTARLAVPSRAPRKTTLPLAEIPPPLALVRQLATRRFAAPVIIACAAVALLVNEVTYNHTRNALKVGSALTEARIAAAGMLQLLADAETGQRGYLLTGRSEYLAPLDAAKLEVPRLGATVSSFLEASGVDGHGVATRMAEDIRATLAEIEKTVEMERLGDRNGALKLVDSGRGKLRMDDMRVIFGVSLVEAALRQQDARNSIEATLWMNRVAVATLILLGAIGLGFYVRHLRLYDRERKDLQDLLQAQVRERTAQLSELAGHLLTAREDEKAHLARELHDELGGMLTAAKLDMARMRARVADDPWMVERIKQVNLRLQEGIALSRRIVEDLRPSSLATLGLTITLVNLCAEAGERLDVVIQTDFDDVDLSADGHLAVYRLIQEALTNIGKYAKASNVRVSVKLEPGVVRVRIQDDGVGFDPARSKPGSHGIAGMRFRIEQLKGTLSVKSSDVAGTCLEATLPSASAPPHLALA